MGITRTEQVIQQAVIANRLDSIAKEMGVVLERSARSPIFAEACDFACGICDASGELVSQLSGIPILASAGSFSVKAVLERYGTGIEDGDVFIINDPYKGGNHLPDIGIITPVFDGNQLAFFCVSRAHHGDIGGSAAGSYNSKATEIFQEGLRIPPTRLISRGSILKDVMELITYNTRNPDMLKSDLMAQVGANQIGATRLKHLIGSYSSGLVCRVVNEILEQTEQVVRDRISSLPDGIYCGVELVDDDGFQQDPIHIKVSIIKEGPELTVDFAGTDAQVKGFVNTSIVTTMTAARVAVLWVLGADIPRNGGAFRAIKVTAPHGTVVNPREPAPVTLCTLTPAGEIIAAIFKALEPIASGNIPAGYGRYCGPSFFGVDPRDGKFYVGFAFCALGSGGAMEGMDGKPYQSPMSNYGGVRAPNIESNEIQYPHLTLYHQFEPDTAGAGQFRGGAGIRYSIRFYDDHPGIVMFGDGVKVPPYGLHGGMPGSTNCPTLMLNSGESVQLGSKESPRFLGKGDTVTLVTSGGGGWGRPFDRDPRLVWEDVRDGIITPESARQIYGVIISDEGMSFARQMHTDRERMDKKVE